MSSINPLDLKNSVAIVPKPVQSNTFIRIFLKYCCCCCIRNKIAPAPISPNVKNEHPLRKASPITAAGAGSASSAIYPKDLPSKDLSIEGIGSKEALSKVAKKDTEVTKPGTPYCTTVMKLSPLLSPPSTPDDGFSIKGDDATTKKLPFLPVNSLVATAGAGIDDLIIELIAPPSTPTDEYLLKHPYLEAFTLPPPLTKVLSKVDSKIPTPYLTKEDSPRSLPSRRSPSPFSFIDPALSSPRIYSPRSPVNHLSPINEIIEGYAELFTRDGLKKELPDVDPETKLAIIKCILKTKSVHAITALYAIINREEHHALFNGENQKIKTEIEGYLKHQTTLDFLKKFK